MIVYNRGIWIPKIHDPCLIKLHAKKMTDDACAAKMGFSAAAIRHHRNKLGLPTIYASKAPGRKPDPAPLPPQSIGVISEINTCLNPETGTKRVVRKWVRETELNFLDGIPASLEKIMQEVNRLRRLAGQPPVGPAHWHG